MLGAAPDPEVQQLIFLWIWHLSGVIAKPNPQASPWSSHLTTKPDVHYHFNRKGRWLNELFSIIFLFSICYLFIFPWLISMGLLLLTEYFNQWPYNKRDTALCLPCSKLQQAAVISVYQAGYWCWPWQRSATRWAGSQTSSQKREACLVIR